MEFEKASIYIDMDSLFDTRAAVITEAFGPEKFLEVLDGDYYERLTDEFKGVDRDAYKEAYANRSVSILKHALVTPMLRSVHEFAYKTLSAVVNTPLRRQPVVVLNVYPYKLTEDEKKLQVLGIRAATKGQMDVKVIDAPLDEITPTYVRENYIRMIMYSYWEWLEVHSLTRALADSRCQQVGLVGPQLIKSSEAVKELAHVNAFTAIEEYTSRFIQLGLIPVGNYCVDLERFKAYQAQSVKTD